jgi:peroxiredoxin
MKELGQLETHLQDFESRNARIIAVSIEGPDLARQTQADFPHLLVLSDSERSLAGAAEVLHAHSAPDGGDTSAPTTILLDRDGKVCWLFRPTRHLRRLSPSEVAAALDQHVPAVR